MAPTVKWGQIAAGAAIIALTLGDVIPGDEFLGVPVGAAMVFQGLGWLK